MLKKYALFIALSFTLLLAFLSLSSFGNVPNLGFSFSDKLFHFLAYAVLTFVWANYFFTRSPSKLKNSLIIIAVIIAVVFGIIIEVLQGQFTTNRVPEFYDAVSNTIGALVAALIMKLKIRLS